MLLLYRVARDGAAGVSLHANALNLAAVAVRGVFVGGGHFGSSAFALTEVRRLGPGAALALVLALHPATAARFALSAERPRAPRAPEDFPTAALAAGCVGWASSRRCSRRTSTTFFADLPGGVDLPRGGRGAAAARVLLRTKRLPALTAHALFLWALSGALRLLLWVILLLEGELHLWLMLGDFVHVALLADFVALYVQSLAAGELAGEGMAMGELDV